MAQCSDRLVHEAEAVSNVLSPPTLAPAPHPPAQEATEDAASLVEDEEGRLGHVNADFT